MRVKAISNAAHAENRREPRSRTFWGGKIVSRNGGLSFDCVVRDLSEVGTQTDVPSGAIFPVRVYLIAANLPVAYDAEVIWTRGNRAGLKFHSCLQFSSGNNPAPGFLKTLHSE